MRFRSSYPPGTLPLVVLLLSAPLSAQAPPGDPTVRAGYRAADVLAVPITRVVGADTGPDRIRGALWGAGIGVLVGGLLGGLTVGSDESDDGFGDPLVEGAATVESVVLGALAGGAIGALLGATVFAPSRRPTGLAAREPTFLVSPSVSASGAGVSARLRLGPGAPE